MHVLALSNSLLGSYGKDPSTLIFMEIFPPGTYLRNSFVAAACARRTLTVHLLTWTCKNIKAPHHFDKRLVPFMKRKACATSTLECETNNTPQTNAFMHKYKHEILVFRCHTGSSMPGA